MTCSRNNWLEWFLSKIVQAYDAKKLGYFTLRVVPGRILAPNGKPIQVLKDERRVTVLSDEDLVAAAEGLGQLLERIQERPELFESVVPNDGSGLEALSYEPASVCEAVQNYEQCAQINEGDDHPTLIAFMKAHLAIYHDAIKRKLSVVYCLSLY